MWIWDTWALITMSLSCNTLSCTIIGVHILSTVMKTSNTFLGIPGIWVWRNPFFIRLEWKHVIWCALKRYRCIQWDACKLHDSCGVGYWKLEEKICEVMKWFDAKKSKYTHLSRSCSLWINFLKRRRMNLSQEIIGNIVDDLEAHGWKGDY